jgi:serine/threonine-protein kinase
LVLLDLLRHGFDAFMDLESINSGEFEKIILAQISARAHFVLILEPGSLEGVDDDADWLRREIRHALACKRNIVPVTASGFSLNADLKLPPDIFGVSRFNAMSIPMDYVQEALQRLRERFLEVANTPTLEVVSTDGAAVAEDRMRQVLEQPVSPGAVAEMPTGLPEVEPGIAVRDVEDSHSTLHVGDKDESSDGASSSPRYEIGQILGHGRMSEVHRGVDTQLGRDVAVKVLRAEIARDPEFQMRFRRGARDAAVLDHPGIVAIYDDGEIQGEFGPLPYIVMEYVDGRTLREIVETQGPMSQQWVLDVMADVCAALDFSHRHQIIHCDLKPGNVMIDEAGAVKLTGFDLARAPGEYPTETQTVAIISTAQYMSPERARGEAIDARSDVYAAGCMLYELLTGEPPFTGDAPVAVAYRHVREDPKPPSEVNPEVPPQLDAVVLKALSKNPDNRYQSAAEMRSDLIRVRSEQPPLAPLVMSADERAAMLAAGSVVTATRQIDSTEGLPLLPPPNEHLAKESAWRTSEVVAKVVGLMVIIGLVGLIANLVLAGPAPVEIPGVVGQIRPDALNQIAAAGLRIGIVTEKDATTDQIGKVLSTNPAAGTQVARQSSVDLVVGTGPALVDMPDLAGMSVVDADALLKSHGLRLGTHSTYPTSDLDLVGKILDSTPGAGERVKAGSTVDITIAS